MSGPVHSSHDHAHEAAAHGSVKSYLIGFVWAVILTVIPFGLAMSGFFPAGVTAAIAALCAAVQIVVHLVYFLHMDLTPAQRSNAMVFISTVVVIGIVIVGSLWVLHNMNANMMH
ncbi:cytochrome o ubiquinol oxidase subunit IV [Pseudoxanthomonas winnipegensis]|uniref:cytochrome o ubiquinol oxidase subunit IV n=1 Tax=Pseudoxanthomonas winnipegensis TaxID=2480810 RepID=UPI0030F3BBBB